MEEEPLLLPESEGMQQAETGQDENVGEQKWGVAVGPGGWRRQRAEAVRLVVAAAAAVAMTAF